MNTVEKKQGSESKLLDVLLGQSEQFTLEHRILTAATLASSFICVLFIVLTITFPFPPSGLLISLISTIIFSLLYVLSRRQGNYQKLIWVYLVVNFIIIVFVWLFVSGYAGTSLSIALVLLCVVPILLSGRQMYIAFVAIGFLLLTVYIIEMFYPEQMIQHENLSLFMKERFLSIVFLGYGVAFLICLVMRSYHLQDSKIRTLNNSLEERNISLQKRNAELDRALNEVKTLSGLLPICAHCKKIRDDGGYWNQIEKYIKDHSEADFSHSICPECMKKHFDIEVQK
jgi:hypothetical protein